MAQNTKKNHTPCGLQVPSNLCTEGLRIYSEVWQPDVCGQQAMGAGCQSPGLGGLSGAMSCPLLSDPGLSPPDSSFHQLCPLATAYLSDRWSHCPGRGRASCILQSPACLHGAQLGAALG